MFSIRKIALPLALILAVFFFAGMTCSSLVLASQTQAEQCCDKDPAPQAPVDNGECYDCGCPSCQLALYTPDALEEQRERTALTSIWSYTEDLPPGYIRTIDYPPEVA